MKYISSNTKAIYDIDFTKKRDKCPECNNTAKKNKTDRPFAYYKETNTAYCFRCEATFFEYKPFEAKQYKIPEWKNKTDLTNKAVKYFESRMISQKTLNECKVYSDVEYMPQFEKEIEVICFPFFVNETLVNIKYRGAKKSFKLVSGAKLVFWNFDAIVEYNEIIIVEGEMDALSWWQAGYKNVISVPNGAGKNTEYLDECVEMLSKKDKVFIAVDIDDKGLILRDELIRRIGFDKCYVVNYRGCKDTNEFAIKYGHVELPELIKESRLMPVEGVITADNIYNDLVEYWKQGDKSGLKINFPELDELITWETGRLAIGTGVPGSGKSEFVDYVVSKLNLLHGWKAAYFTPENYPLKYHYQKLFEKYVGKTFNEKFTSTVEFDMAFEHINENYFYIQPEEETSLTYILERAKYLIKTKGIKVLVIDPYNKIEHQYEKSETQYISQFLDKLTHFAKMYNILVFLVAHPRKMERGTVPSLYDISGSANFYNKTDYGFTVDRGKDEKGSMNNDVSVYIQKVKFKHLGKQGVVEMKYNYQNGRFESINKEFDKWERDNWLSSDSSTETKQIEIFEALPFNIDFENEPPF